MAKGSVLLFLSAVVVAVGFGSTAPKAADAEEIECSGSSSQAVRTLPAPLRKWGHISCTEFGDMLASRQGWVWAWLDGSGSVAIPSQMVRRNPKSLGNQSYFAFSIFHDGLPLDKGRVKGYRVNLTSVSGKSTTIYFFDFDTFAGGMWCPDDACVPDRRFMIMEEDHKALLRAASV